MMSENWTKCSAKMTAQNVVVETKIDDGKGVRNEQDLKLVKGLWFFPDESMHIYYAPTHWRATR